MPRMSLALRFGPGFQVVDTSIVDVENYYEPKQSAGVQAPAATAKAKDIKAGPWLDAAQAVEYLSMPSIKALYQAVRKGHVPALKFGRRLRFWKPDLDQALRTGGVRVRRDVPAKKKAR